MEDKTKVIIISGFLGAGKTTLIENILKAPMLKHKVAVIQNEFSMEMGLESALMRDSEGNEIKDFYEMPNGCICCAGKYLIVHLLMCDNRGDLINTLDTLLGKNPFISYILVETNGLADPSQVIQLFWVDDGLGSKVTLHQVIGVIDSFSFTTKWHNHTKLARKPLELQANSINMSEYTEENGGYSEQELM